MYVLASALILAVLVAPFALAAGEGNSVRGGKRNPSANKRLAYSAETQILTSNSTYGTRQSNKGQRRWSGLRVPLGSGQ